MEPIFHWIAQYGYVAIFALLMLGIVGLPIPDETLLIFSGYLAFKGDLHIVPTVASAFLGSMCGITISYVLGRSVGNYLITQYGHIVHITPQKMDQVHDWFNRAGRWGLTFGYFLPGIRHLTAFTAGTSKLRLSVFALFTYTGGFIWSATFISLGYFMGKEWIQASERLHRLLLIGSGIIIALLVAYVLAKQKKHKEN
jgi:membrane protein DedA with SNARE-associated domain